MRLRFKSLSISRQRDERRALAQLIRILDLVQLYLSCGYDFVYSWREATRVCREGISESLFAELSFADDLETGSQRLKLLGERFSLARFRIWFLVLSELYGKGAELGPPLRAILSALRQEEERDRESFFRQLPTRVNVALIVFFLPPALGLVFLPLLVELLGL